MLSHGIIFFFFKKKTADDIRSSDCSSDVCSSDLSDGDVEMLQHTGDTTSGILLSVLVHQDASKNDSACYEEIESALEMAKNRGWLVINMKEDFKRIFPFEIE